MSAATGAVSNDLRPAPGTRRPGRRRPAPLPLLLRVGTLVAVVVAWQILSGFMSKVVLPSPRDFVDALGQLLASGELLSAWGTSLVNIVIATAASAVIGLVLGVALGRYEMIEGVSAPVLLSVFLTPKIAFLPIIALWLGYERNAKILFIFAFTIFEMLYTVRTGVKAIGDRYYEFGRSICLRERDMVRKLIVPAIWPYTIVALRLSLLHGLVGAVLAGFFLQNSGIGGLVYTAGSQFRTADLFAVIFTIMIVGLIISVGLSWLERRLIPWQRADAR